MTLPSLSRLVIPDDWRGIIDQVDAMFPGAVLCGGALRDLLWGKKDQVKDLDFVIGQPFNRINDAIEYPGEDWHMVAVFNRNYFGFRQDVIRVERYEIGLGDYPNVELIYLDAPMGGLAERVVRRNDFGCCQVAYRPRDHFEGLVYSKAFFHDVSLNRFTLVNCEDAMQAARSLRRAERWRAKYPEIHMDLTKAEERLHYA